jgi:hypothetical protein
MQQQFNASQQVNQQFHEHQQPAEAFSNHEQQLLQQLQQMQNQDGRIIQ